MAYAIKSAGYARNAGKRWRSEDVRALKAFVRQGLSLRLISLKLGRPDNAIRSKAGALGLSVLSEPAVIAPPPARTLTRTGSRATGMRAVTQQTDLFGTA